MIPLYGTLIPYPKPPLSVELRNGYVYSGCQCVKRNGLQQNCPRKGCQGRHQCLAFPVPLCEPSGCVPSKIKQRHQQQDLEQQTQEHKTPQEQNRLQQQNKIQQQKQSQQQKQPQQPKRPQQQKQHPKICEVGDEITSSTYRETDCTKENCLKNSGYYNGEKFIILGRQGYVDNPPVMPHRVPCAEHSKPRK